MWWLFLLLTQAYASNNLTWTPEGGTLEGGTVQIGDCNNLEHIHAAICGRALTCPEITTAKEYVNAQCCQCL